MQNNFQSIFSFTGEINSKTHFKVYVLNSNKDVFSHESAFMAFTGFTLCFDEYKNLYHCTKRGYKFLLRNAKIKPDKFLHTMMMNASPIGPIYCMKDISGWVFFGAK